MVAPKSSTLRLTCSFCRHTIEIWADPNDPDSWPRHACHSARPYDIMTVAAKGHRNWTTANRYG